MKDSEKNLALLAHLFAQVGTGITDISLNAEGNYIFQLVAFDEDVHKFFRACRTFLREHPNYSDWEYAPGVFRKEFRDIGTPQWYYVCRQPTLEFKFYKKCLESGYFGGSRC